MPFVPKQWPPQHQSVADTRALLQKYRQWEHWKESQLCSLSWTEVDAIDLYLEELSIQMIATRLVLTEQQVTEALNGATGKLYHGFSDYCASLTHLNGGHEPGKAMLKKLCYDRPLHLHPVSANVVTQLLATGYTSFRDMLRDESMWYQLAHGCMKGTDMAAHSELRLLFARYRCLVKIMSPDELYNRHKQW